MREEATISKNKVQLNKREDNSIISAQEISKTWKNGFIDKVESETEKGLRKPQYGALSAIRAHWTVSSKPATVVLPTGTGKTETMLATILSEQVTSVLIIVPSNFLREQTYNKAKTFGKLPDLGMVGKDVCFPNVVLYKSRIKDDLELWTLFSDANIIVSTVNAINNLSENILQQLVEKVDVLMIDEVHHIGASGWSELRKKFLSKLILQFTATPFRDDGKKIDGEIIYNYGLSLAQKDGYFIPIDFFPIEEFNENLGDEKIAEKAIELLSKDLDQGFEHQLLVRAKSKKRAEELFENVYSKYSEFNPILIISGRSNQSAMKELKSGRSKLVVCVDMFGEGIDIPNLKIAAIHDKYKSLPITLQFIGRFARSSKGLGNAKVITNIANDDLKESLQTLYSQDADWNQLLSMHSSDAIQSEVVNRRFINQFYDNSNGYIDINQLKMKISTRIFYLNESKWVKDAWQSVLNIDETDVFYNEEASTMILVESVESSVDWSSQKDLSEYNYDLFVIYVDKVNGLIFLNETNSQKGNRLIKYSFKNATQVSGEKIFRVLDGINQLMIGTLGLKEQPSGRISFRMLAGTNIKEGINQVIRGKTTKSNLFATGFKNKSKISIGCSYKGKVWMRWVESIQFWREWCQKIGTQVLDDSIETDSILENSLISEEIEKFPSGIPYKISMIEEFELANSEQKILYFEKEEVSIPFFMSEFNNPRITKDGLDFDLWINARKCTFNQSFIKNGFIIRQIDGAKIKIKKSRNTIDIEEYIHENPPQITFINENGAISIVEGNLMVKKKPISIVELPEDKIIQVDWQQYGVDIKKESQGIEKIQNTIQYATIQELVDKESIVIFDDDSAGEISDVISIIVDSTLRSISIHLFHCKYSHGTKAGARVADLYEVCGQAEKSIIWNYSIIELLRRMKSRELHRVQEGKVSRFEKGDLSDLRTLENQIKAGFITEMKISIVQPGISVSKITVPMKQLLLATDTYLKETYGIDFSCYFSK